jgi:hypothetical protein
MTKTYTSTLPLPRDLTLDAVEYIVEKVREVVYPAELVTEGGIMPTALRIEFELEDGEDGWDLHERVHELADELGDCLGTQVGIPRPTPKPE